MAWGFTALPTGTGGTGGTKAPVAPKRLPKKLPTAPRGPKPVPSSQPQAYDPWKPSFATQADFDKAVQAQAQASIQPGLNEVDWERQQAQGAHATREKELQSWSGYEGDQLGKAFSDTRNALSNLVGLRAQGGVDAQNTLAAALRGTAGQEQGLATQLGGTAPPSQDASVLAAAAANDTANQNALFGTAGALTAGAGERQGLSAVAGSEADRAEQTRLNAILNQNTQQRKDIMGRLPDLVTQARTTLGEQEFQHQLARKQFGDAHANQLFQQYLAQQQLGLSKRQESFQEWLSGQNLSLDTAKFQESKSEFSQQIGLDQQKVQAQIDAIKAQGKKAKDKASQDASKLRAQQWNTGLGLLQNYLAPVTGEGSPGQRGQVPLTDKNGKPLTQKDTNGNDVPVYAKPYNRKYNDAVRILMGQGGMSRSDALRLLTSSDFPSWRSRARSELSRLKRRKLGGGPDPTKQVSQLLNPKFSGPVSNVLTPNPPINLP